MPCCSPTTTSTTSITSIVTRLVRAVAPRFVVPLGVGAHLERWGVPPARVHELDWWEELTLGETRWR